MWLLVVVINNTLEKTTTPYSNRTYEHFYKCKSSVIYIHQRNCDKCVNGDDCSVGICRELFLRESTSGTQE